MSLVAEKVWGTSAGHKTGADPGEFSSPISPSSHSQLLILLLCLGLPS